MSPITAGGSPTGSPGGFLGYTPSMSPEILELATPDAPIEAVSAELRGEDSPGTPVLLAHGAGVPMDSPFMQHVAEGLAASGRHPVLCFNYAYAERMRIEGKRRPPDRRPGLEAVHRAALAWLEERTGRRPVLAGKSMGGRMSSYLAAEGEGSGLLLYGYPLHPAAKPEKIRSEHFPSLAQPALFLQGTRDALATPALLEEQLETYGGQLAVHWIEEGDHDFAVPKRTGRSREEVLDELVRVSLEWLEGLD